MLDDIYLFMQNLLSLGYMLRVLLAVSANFHDNPRIIFCHRTESDLLFFLLHIVLYEHIGYVIQNSIHAYTCSTLVDYVLIQISWFFF